MSRSNGAVRHVGPIQLPEIGGDRAGRFRAQAGNQIARVGETLGSKGSDARGFLADATTAARSRADAAAARARSRADAAAARARRKADAAAVRLQLANTSRELANETSDLGQAVESLNAIVKANRKTAAAKRRRLFAGVALGAGLAYHLDPAHGRQRRAATASLLTGAARGGLDRARAAAEARSAGRTRSA